MSLLDLSLTFPIATQRPCSTCPRVPVHQAEDTFSGQKVQFTVTRKGFMVPECYVAMGTLARRFHSDMALGKFTTSSMFATVKESSLAGPVPFTGSGEQSG